MEQVDQIILVTLKDIGVELDLTEIRSLAQLTDRLVVSAVARCINIITNKGVSERLPEGMAMRYRLGLELSALCKDIGYTADLGYQTFLYSNELEIRRLLMFLVEQLPRARDDDVTSDVTTSSLKLNIAQEMRRQLVLPWLPCLSNPVWEGNRKTGRYHYIGGYRHYNAVKIGKSEDKALGEQCRGEELLSSLLELSTKLNQELDISTLQLTPTSGEKAREKIRRGREDVVSRADHVTTEERRGKEEERGSKEEERGVGREHNMFTITENVLHHGADKSSEDKEEEDKEEEEEELIRQHEEEKGVLVTSLTTLTSKQEETHSKISSASKKLTDLTEVKKKREEEMETLKSEYLLKKKTLQLVPQEQDAVSAMKEKVNQAHSENKQVKELWSSKESDFTEEIGALEVELSTKTLQTSEYVEEVRLMKQEIGELVSSLQEKEERKEGLEVQVSQLTGNINRSTHTKKILDIVDKIRKQKAHINTILSETKVVQKDINSYNGKIERSFIETDEMIFRGAKGNDQCRKAYKLLASLQAEFTGLVRGLDDIGAINRELREIEELVSRERQRNTGKLISKVSADLEEIIKDNDNMIKAIKQAKHHG